MLSKFKIYFPSPIHMYTGFPSPTQKYKKKKPRDKETTIHEGRCVKNLKHIKLSVYEFFFMGGVFTALYCNLGKYMCNKNKTKNIFISSSI